MIWIISLTLLVALSFAREREEGTLDQLRLTPYPPAHLLLAKGLAAVLVGLLQLAVCLAVVFLHYRIPLRGSPAALAALVGGFLACAAGFGLLVSVRCANLQQAMISTFLLVLPLVLLSGMATPVAGMPPVLQAATLANPLRWSVAALRRLFLEGAGVADLLPTLAVLYPLGLAAFALSILDLRRQFRA